MVIRKISTRTAPSVLPLLEAQYRDHGIEMRGRPLLRALRTLLRGHGFVLAALDPHPIGVAAVSWEWSLERAGLQAWLEELYVVPERRGQGAGRGLLRKATAAAKRSGCVSMELEVIRGHDRAARLYLREGFARLPRARYSRTLKPVAVSR
ncbi:MAG: GNAT family N-acetyltransferase [Myxococcales bacterium]|nr:GNAT family N-acetyltransferase [Myxococcales bacterium]